MRVALIFILLAVILLPNCKRGEEDPFLSLRTRKARVTGHWQLKYFMGSHTVSNANDEVVNVKYYYNSNVNTELNVYYNYLSDGYGTYLYAENFDVTMDVLKDNTMECYVRSQGISDLNNDSRGGWDWTKTGKNKEYVNFEALNFIYYDFTNYRIHKLTNDELIIYLELDEGYEDVNGVWTNIIGSHELIFEKHEISY